MSERRIALVTGASRGIGKAIALKLARKGNMVYINFSSNVDAAEEVAQECRAAGGDAALLQFNVADRAEVDAAMKKIKTEQGGLDVLVNNAGITLNGLALRTSDEQWQKVMDINLTGSFYVARAALKLLMKSKAGRIINISSVVGEMGNPGQSAYVASKAGIIGLTKSLAKEVASRAVTVNVVTPGFISTDMTDELPDDVREKHLEAISLGRYGTPEEVAAAVSFLSSEEAGYITGQILGVNGGLYM